MKPNPGQLRRFVGAWVAVAAAYAIYALVAVPWIEGPPKRGRDAPLLPLEFANQAPDLGRWLPEGAWELQPCKRLDTTNGHLIFQDYQPHDDGRVEVRPLTILYRSAESTPDDPPIVLRSEQGAVLKFDAPLNLSGKTGQLEGGMLYGPVEISRAATAPDKHDDWRIVTSDVQMNNERIQTLQPVDFRFGENVGHARHLIVTLDRDPLRAGQKTMASVRGAARIELVHVTQLQLVAPAAQTLDPSAAAQVHDRNEPSPDVISPADVAAKPTIYHVNCSGPLIVDVRAGIASLNEQVVLTSADNPLDWMRADRLELSFGDSQTLQPDGTSIIAMDSGADAPGQVRNDRNWQVQTITVVGQPAQINLESRQVALTGDQLTYDLVRDSVRIVNSAPRTVRQAGFELTASDLVCQRLPDGSIGPSTIRGPGRLVQAATADGQAPLIVDWQEKLDVAIEDGRKKLTIRGGVTATLDPQTSLEVDQLEIWFDQGRDEATGKETIALSKLVATGNVHIAADRIDLRVKQLLAYWPESSIAAARTLESGRSAYVGVQPQEPAGDTHPAAVVEAQPALPANPPVRAATLEPQVATLPLYVRGDVATIRFRSPSSEQGAGDTPNAFQEITLDGNVLLEQRSAVDREVEMRIDGQHLNVVPQDELHRRIRVRGEPNRPVVIAAASMQMKGYQVTVDQSANRLWIDGPGDLRGELTGTAASLAAQNAAARGELQPREDTGPPRELHLEWSAGMVFDGEQVYFESNVVADIREASDTGAVVTRVACEAINMSLDRRIDLSGSTDASPTGDSAAAGKIEVITLAGHVPADKRVFGRGAPDDPATARLAMLERRVVDPMQSLIQLERFEVPWLQLDLQTGAITSNGPGSLSAWHPTSSLDQVPAPGVETPRLDALGNTQIKFDRGIRGNIQNSDITFEHNVRVIHGPVRDVGEQLDADTAELIAGRYRLRADQLRVVQWQKTSEVEPHLEMIAQGQLQLEGELFSAFAQRLSFDQSRQMIVLEGDARNQARMEYQTALGAPRNPLVAAKIKYRLRDQAAEAEGITHGVISTGPLPERRR